jgi:trans-2,3-dihydro-3-hydroxyanthranilate isomerase
VSLNYYITDVFTQEAFAGAQIAVFPHAVDIDNEKMQLIARELNLSETVFITNPQQSDKHRALRIFSPLKEIDFAGHPIIAAAYVLATIGEISSEKGNTQVCFSQNRGDFEVNVSFSNDNVNLVQFSQKVASVIDRFTPADNELAEFLSLDVRDLDHKKYTTRLVSCGFPYLVVPVWDYDSVRNAKFNFATWSQSAAPQTAAQEILLFSPKTPYQDANFNARLLGPNIGPHEDPPVGSAMPAFASYLCSFDFTQTGTHTFAVDRGDKQSRRSVIHMEMDHKPQSDLTLRVGGQAVMMAEGKLLV